MCASISRFSANCSHLMSSRSWYTSRAIMAASLPSSGSSQPMLMSAIRQRRSPWPLFSLAILKRSQASCACETPSARCFCRMRLCSSSTSFRVSFSMWLCRTPLATPTVAALQMCVSTITARACAWPLLLATCLKRSAASPAREVPACGRILMTCSFAAVQVACAWPSRLPDPWKNSLAWSTVMTTFSLTWRRGGCARWAAAKSRASRAVTSAASGRPSLSWSSAASRSFSAWNPIEGFIAATAGGARRPSFGRVHSATALQALRMPAASAPASTGAPVGAMGPRFRPARLSRQRVGLARAERA
mmetsp:Transcript_20799/g.61966  ORF Transcript_20799/g.61966 Transcript_20799/m.61966 type:complete len:304 (+) Transcript_20799:747-1658(+)